MALSKGFRAYEKNSPPVYSILLEHRNKAETLLLESQAVAVLCKNYLSIFFEQVNPTFNYKLQHKVKLKQ